MDKTGNQGKEHHGKIHPFFRKSLKVIGWIFGILFLIIILLVVALQFPQTQTFLTKKAVSFVEKKIQTPVELGGINISFPKSIWLQDIYVEDQNQDTLLYCHSLEVDVDLLGLLSNKVQVNSIEIENFKSHIYRTLPDSAFNFDYITKAFADTTTVQQEDTTTGKPWEISVLGLEIQNTRLQYDDEVSGMYANLNLGAFNVDMDEFNLDSMKFKIDEILLENTVASYKVTKTSTTDSTTAESPTDSTSTETSPPLDVDLNQLNLNNLTLNYDDQVAGQKALVKIGKSVLDVNEINLPEQKIDLETFGLSGTQIAYTQAALPQDSTTQVTDTTQTAADTVSAPISLDFGWLVAINQINLENNNLKYDDKNQPRADRGMDFSHIWVSGFTLKINDIDLDRKSARANITAFNFKEHSGFRLQNLSGKLVAENTKASLTDFNLKTGYSDFSAQLKSEYPNLDALTNDLQSIFIDAEIPESHLAYQDLLFFQPDLADSLPLNIPDDFALTFNSKLNGKVNDLNLENLKLAMLNQTALTANGHIGGLPDTDQASFNLNANFNTAKTDLVRILPDTMLPAGFQIPKDIKLTTAVNGSMADLVTNTRLQTTLGAIAARLRLQNVQSDNPVYDGQLTVNQFELGQLMGNPDTIGVVDLQMKANGAGFDPETMKTSFDGKINTFEYLNYAYNNLSLDGSIDGQHYIANANIDDQNLAFSFDGDINMNKEIPEYKVNLDLQKAYLKDLKLATDDLRVKTHIVADLSFANIDEINGDFGIRELAVYKDGELFNVDSFLVASVSQQRKTSLKIDSDILAAEFKGNIGFGTLPTALNQHFNTYYSLHDTTITENTEEQNFEFTIDLKQTALITDVLLPELGEFNPGEIKGEYNSKAKKLALNMEIPVIEYAGFNMDSLALNIDSDAEKLTYGFKIAHLTDSTYKIDNFSIGGKVQNDSIFTRLLIQDSTYKDKIKLAGMFFSREENYEFRFAKNGVRLNYVDWNLPADHFLKFGDSGFTTNNFVLSHESQEIALSSENKVLNVDFKDFQLGFLSSMIEGHEKIVRGILNGNVKLDNQQAAMAFNTKLNINDFSYLGDTVGNLAIKANNPQSNRYNAQLDISGFGNSAQIAGYYLSDSLNPSMDFTLDLNKLNLASIESFTGGQLAKAKGFINGKIDITGEPSDPTIEGALRFNGVNFLATYINSELSIDNQAINFANDQVQFNKFTISDANKETLVVDGNVDMANMASPVLNLTISSNNFLALNTSADDNDMYYGKLFLDSNVKITGNASEPSVDVNLGIGDNTNLTYIVPVSETGSAEQEGIVEFVDKDKAGEDFFTDIQNQESGDTLKSPLGMDLTANINVTKASHFTVVIDPTSGDQLAISGDADLSMNINPAGDISLTGRYEVDQGQYNLSFYGIVKRQFQVKQGSSLVWTGDILDAQADLTAVFELETAPIELMQNYVTDNTDLTVYKQDLPFQVDLNMDGELMKPEISFGLDMPEDARNYAGGNVYSRIQALNQEESQLNKQVFALLVLQRFIAENPFSSSSGGTESAVRSSVSKILSDQLDKLTDQVKGINIDVGLKSYEDYSSGSAEGRTDLNLGLSKQFLNDRVTVKVAGNVNLEGDTQQQRNLSDFAGDVSVEYKLTEDGRFRLVTFRKEVFEQLLEGEVIETGAGFIIVKDYDKFREIFRKEQEENWNKTADDSVSSK